MASAGCAGFSRTTDLRLRLKPLIMFSARGCAGPFVLKEQLRNSSVIGLTTDYLRVRVARRKNSFSVGKFVGPLAKRLHGRSRLRRYWGSHKQPLIVISSRSRFVAGRS